MQFNNFPRKEISYEKKMQIEENKEIWLSLYLSHPSPHDSSRQAL